MCTISAMKVSYLVHSFHTRCFLLLSTSKRWNCGVGPHGLKHHAVRSDMVIQVPLSDLPYSFCPMEQRWFYFTLCRVVFGGKTHLRFQQFQSSLADYLCAHLLTLAPFLAAQVGIIQSTLYVAQFSDAQATDSKALLLNVNYWSDKLKFQLDNSAKLHQFILKI